MKTAKFFSIFTLIAMVSVFIPSFALAGGAGIEPGGGCEAPVEGMKAKYDGPPFIGYLIVHLDSENNLRANGTLERNNPRCEVELQDYLLGPIKGLLFSELKGVDYRLTCLEDGGEGPFGDCEEISEESYLEVIGVGNYYWLDPPENTRFTAKFIIMPLNFR